MSDDKQAGNGKAAGGGIGTPAGWLAIGLTTLTGTLTAVGGLTGGIARMFRNHQWGSVLPFGLVLVAVLAAVMAAVLEESKREELQQFAALAVGLGGTVFAVGVIWAVALMVNTASIEDRPALSAQLAKDSTGAWSVKGTAKSSGLAADEKMQVYVYSLPKDTSECTSGVATSTPSPSSASPTSAASASTTPSASTAAPTPTDEFTPAACGRRLFYASTGPDQDGMVTETFDVPLPAGTDLSAFVVTANLGDVPRNCEGVAFSAQANPQDAFPPVAKKAREQTACITFVPPPVSPLTSTPTT
jgi:cell division septation protein DedD